MFPPPLGQRWGFARCVPAITHQQLYPWLPRWRGGRQNFKKKEKKNENKERYCVGGRWEGSWENGLDFVCVGFFVCFLLVFFGGGSCL